MKKLITNILIIISLVFVTDELLSYLLKSGLDGFYGFHKSAQVVFIGNSRVVAGIDPYIVEKRLGVPVAKYAIGGTNTVDRMILLKHFLSENRDVKYIVYGVDQYTFQTARYKGAEDPYRRLYPYIDNIIVGQYVQQCVGSWEEYYSKYALKLLRYNNQLMSISVRYLLHVPDSSDIKVLTQRSGDSVVNEDLIGLYRSSISDEGIKSFDETLRYASEKGYQVILLFMPTTDVLNRINADNYQQALSLLMQFSRKYAGSVTFCDNYIGMSSTYSLFGDYSHLNRQGQISLSENFASILLNYLKEK